MIERAFSKDGYLTDQSLLGEIPYGGCGSDRNGCGWVAAYNFCRAAGRPLPWETVRTGLERSLLFGGRMGTNIWYLCWYLSRRGYRMHAAFTRAGAGAQAACCRAGVLTYWTGRGIHFAAFMPAKGKKLRFFNAGRPDPDLAEMEAFFDERVKFPLVFAMTARPAEWERARAARTRLRQRGPLRVL